MVITNNNRRGEVRFVAYGYINDLLHVVVYTIRVDAVRRIISIMRGNLRDERYYAGVISPSPEEEVAINAGIPQSQTGR